MIGEDNDTGNGKYCVKAHASEGNNACELPLRRTQGDKAGMDGNGRWNDSQYSEVSKIYTADPANLEPDCVNQDSVNRVIDHGRLPVLHSSESCLNRADRTLTEAAFAVAKIEFPKPDE